MTGHLLIAPSGQATGRLSGHAERPLGRTSAGGSAAVFVAHVDRIRALKNALLTLAASGLLADLLDRSAGTPANFTPLNFTPPHGRAEPATCGNVEKPAPSQSNPSPVKTDPKESS